MERCVKQTAGPSLATMNSIAETQTADAIGPEIRSGSESFYRTALESLSEGVMILDSDCRIIYANRLVHEITGYFPDELLGQTPSLLRAASLASSKLDRFTQTMSRISPTAHHSTISGRRSLPLT